MVAGVAGWGDGGAVGAGELPGSVGEGMELPVVVVDEVVVPFAHHREVVEVGAAAVDPVGEVVELAPRGGAVAAGDDAAVVADGGGDPLVAVWPGAPCGPGAGDGRCRRG